MPQLIIKGITEEQCAELSVKAAPGLSKICDCPSDWFVFDLIHSRFFDENGRIKHCPVIQVWWFKRPELVQDRVAHYLHNTLENMGFPHTQISFHVFDKNDYYEGGEKC